MSATAEGSDLPELLDQSPTGANLPVAVEAQGAGTGLPPAIPGRVAERDERRARDELRRQIAALERELAELFASTFPRRGIEWKVGAAGGPRVLGIADLEQVRDALADRLARARAAVDRRAEEEEQSRALVERMIDRPEEHRWVRVLADDVGERGCRHWHSRPRLGILGMLFGWWRVKLSSGCPLATGRGPAAPRL